MVIIKMNCTLSDYEIKQLHEEYERQIKTGVIVLAAGAEYIELTGGEAYRLDGEIMLLGNK